MQELERTIELYHTLFSVFLFLGIACLIVTVILFFKFDIRKIIDMKTGRGAKRTIQKMEEVNARTGKLREDVILQTPVRLRPEDRISSPDTPPVLQHKKQSAEKAPEPLQEGREETTLLQQEMPETTVLSELPQEESKPKRELPGKFKIQKDVMWIHTNEMI